MTNMTVDEIREYNAQRWPLHTQIQHDTNIAAQDLHGAAARLRRLMERIIREDGPIAQLVTLDRMAKELDELRADLERMK
jgi:hypothetical protein